MGVHGLWELLAPVGRRVSVETLAGKKLAIDASIWMVQFMKAMRDDKGEMVRNAHLLGFFRRICKLLFLRTKPVFVFDGATPALKRRTVMARRRQRENAQAKIRKTAEKLLLNHLKAMKLKELARDLENQRRDQDAKGKKIITDHPVENNLEGNENVSRSYNQEELDELLAASIAAEEDGCLNGNASTSGARIPTEEEDGDEDEEMILPTMQGNVDPAVLAALPPSMQLDLLVQMRERLMAENRQKYQKVKEAPAKFSELQIQAYLKTVAFRREINEVQKSAAGKGVGGVQTSRIASEANREFIFSSSFTGDKQVLTSAGAGSNSDKQHPIPAEHPFSDSLGRITSTKQPNVSNGSNMDKHAREYHDDVETYRDERGRVRVSRVRAMGIRMTRDLQRNLDLMKEIEQAKGNASNIAANEFSLHKDFNDVTRQSVNKSQLSETSHQLIDVPSDLYDENEHSISVNGIPIEISFEDNGEHKGDDELFANLVAGDPVMFSSADNTKAKNQASDSPSDCDWEEGVIDEKSGCLSIEDKMKNLASPAVGGVGDESEVEWEEGSLDAPQHASPCPAENMEILSKGLMIEEADFQEAIRRSLQDLSSKKYVVASSDVDKFEESLEVACDSTNSRDLYEENDKVEEDSCLQNVQEGNGLSGEVVAGVESLNKLDLIDVLRNNNSEDQLDPSIVVDPTNHDILVDKPSERNQHLDLETFSQDTSGDSHRDFGHMEQTNPVKEYESMVAEQHLDSCIEGGQVSICCNSGSGVGIPFSDLVLREVPEVVPADAQKNESDIAKNNQFNETTQLEDLSVADKKSEAKLSVDKIYGGFVNEMDGSVDNFVDEEDKVTEASLEEEMLNLGKERINLGEEQRKLERNMESASSEMFAECQELLQMFGLPYIIAPMEAEAQCAYMELANLVDGVVTDDSDAFLFGARSVFKNIFDDRKYVETYFMKDIENELGLTREKLIHMALLLGSDYTEGISGIGIVNAIEVVNAFSEDGLVKFREWIESPDPNILGQFDVQTGLTSRKGGAKVGSKDVCCSNSNVEGLAEADQNVSQPAERTDIVKQIFMDKHRNVSKNWHIPSSFPSKTVISAYASPQVDKSTDPFSWGKPDLFVLRKLCWEKFGWRNHKADELLMPVLKEYNKHETQLRLEAFYTFNERFAKIRSKRIEKAVRGITGNKSRVMDDSVQEGSESRKKRRVNLNESGDGKLGESLNGTENGVTRDESNFVEKSKANSSRKKTLKEPVLSEAGSPQSGIGTEGKRKVTKKGSRARGRGRGRGRGQAIGRGGRKDVTSSTDGNSSYDEHEVDIEELDASQETRRSARFRKAVKYAENDVEIAEPSKSNQYDKNCINEAAVEEESCENASLVGDDAGGPSNENRHKVGDFPPKGISGDCLAVGGGFCLEEDVVPELETFQGSLNHGGDPSEPCEDYLKMGGGFCADEDGIKGDHDGEDTEKENDLSSHFSGIVGEANNDTGLARSVSSSENASDGLQTGGRGDALDSEQNLESLNSVSGNDSKKVATPQNIMKEDFPVTSSQRPSLSAIPNLRRKRRKT